MGTFLSRTAPLRLCGFGVSVYLVNIEHARVIIFSQSSSAECIRISAHNALEAILAVKPDWEMTDVANRFRGYDCDNRRPRLKTVRFP